jgi:alpha-glucuronidase
VIVGSVESSKFIANLQLSEMPRLGKEGYLIVSLTIEGKSCLVVAAKTDVGALYGSFKLLQELQTHQYFGKMVMVSNPSMQLRMLDHWDNLNRTVERGYAGFSIFKWHLLPGYIDQRYIDYARANASIGINGTVVNNVNANSLMLSKDYLIKVAALADVFRKYGIKTYLSVKFSSPIELGKLKTADPLDPAVIAWWKQKSDEVYKYIPDFGGFVVKANSEGQPGPQNYGRTHADGANMLGDALAPHGGIVIWRAFVYSNETPIDRTKQAYLEFKPFDGQFKPNVIVQVKNGPLDFQPREPFHPLFGAMPKTPLMMEFQLTQEYLGQATHLVYEAPLMTEVLDADTYANGAGSTVTKVVNGSLGKFDLNGMAGVANIGDDRNWTGHPFAQANWYAYGRLAWNPSQNTDRIAEDWIKMSWNTDSQFVAKTKQIMMDSRKVLVQYMTPLGLHHIMGDGHHYGPSPWSDRLGRADWNPVYYHRADSAGIGFERSSKGSNALEQYAPEIRKIYEDPKTCPEQYLLWFHHVAWNFKMKSGKTLWEELCYNYYAGVEAVRQTQKIWAAQKSLVDEERFEQVRQLLLVQEQEAIWWRNACLLYFGTFSKMPIPAGYEQPDHDLKYYQSLRFPFAPGNGGSN